MKVRRLSLGLVALLALVALALIATRDARQRAADEAAIRRYDAALRANPADASALVSRGATYYQLGDYDAAIADATRALEIQPNTLFPLQNRAAAHREKGDFAAAYADYKRAYDLCMMASHCAESSPHRFQSIESGMREMKLKSEGDGVD